MDKETSVIALAIVTILLVFVAVQPLIPYNSEQFSELGTLGPQKTIANYPTTLTVNQNFLLYGYIGNHQGTVEYYTLFVKLGNVNTIISNTTSSNAPVLSTYSYVLNNGQNTTFPMNLSIGQNGTNLRLILELWMYNQSSSAFSYTGLWNQLWINVTSP